jgi:riboflavin biosynthesis pyrimidine reductase
LFVGARTPKARLKKFEKSSELVILKPATPKKPLAQQVLGHLEATGKKRILVEGGGGVMWDFVSQNLIDEYHVTVTPRILGGTEAPTLVDGAGFLPGKTRVLSLMQCRAIGDELYLIYRKTEKRA